MNIYFIDQPLTSDELASAARLLSTAPMPGSILDLRQVRIPGILPVADRGGCFTLKLLDYAPHFQRLFVRAGAGSVKDEPVAFLRQNSRGPNPLNAVLMLALREVTGVVPYVLNRSAHSGIQVSGPDPLIGLLRHGLSGRPDRRARGKA